MKSKFLNVIVATMLVGSVSYSALSDGGHSQHGKKEKQHSKHDEVMVHAKVNSVDLKNRKINVSHGAIKQLSWPAMTMDMKVAENVDLSSVKAGQELMIALTRGEDGIYLISKLMMH